MKVFSIPYTLLLFLYAGIAFASPAARWYDAGLRALSHGEQEKAKTALQKAVALNATLADALQIYPACGVLACVLGLIHSGAAEFHAAAE